MPGSFSQRMETLAQADNRRLPLHLCVSVSFWKAFERSAPSNLPGGGGRIKYCLQMYSFLVAALTNDHKLTGFKQYKFMIIQFWRSEVLKSTCSQSCVPSGSPQEEPLSLPFSASRTTCIPWFVAPSSIFKAKTVAS